MSEPAIAALILVIMMGLIANSLRKDRAAYDRFKALETTDARQRTFLFWVLTSFMLYGFCALVILAVFGRLGDIIRMPPEFQPFHDRVNEALSSATEQSGLLVGMALGALVAGIAMGIIAKRNKASTPVVLGDIAPLLPRNKGEKLCAALLSINAGFSEELFFRLVLPLLITLMTGQVILALVLSVLFFGIVHLYQGIVGVVATTFFGIVMTGLYFYSGQLWLAMASHAGLNTMTLIVRPSVSSLIAKRAKS